MPGTITHTTVSAAAPALAATGLLPQVSAGALPRFTPIATDEIVTIGDRTGIFTPLASKGGDDTDNLSRIVDVLKSELAESRAGTAALQAKLDALGTPARSADNLAEGVQNALDSLADRLGTMENTTSNFAVREFTLESKVHVDVTALGTIGFQFVKPGEKVDAAALSTVTLTVVPIPKPLPDPAAVATLTGAGDAAAAGPTPAPVAGAPLEALGLSDEQTSRLRGAHIASTSDFTRVATRATASAELVSMLGISRAELGRYALLAGLLTVPGVDETAARVLSAAGIRDVATLASSRGSSLVTRYAKAADGLDGVGRHRPDLEEVTAWITAARALTGVPPA